MRRTAPADRLASRWLDVGSYRMHMRVSAGASRPGGPAAVLVHGLVVSSRSMIPAARCLARDYDVYSPDLPGFGLSEKPAHALDIPALADVLRHWMDAAGLARAVVLAHSMGCQVAADFAARWPERVDRLVLVGPTMDPAARTTLRQLRRLAYDTPLEPASYVWVTLRDFLAAGFRRTLFTFRHALRHPIEERLTGIRAPALVVRGGRDPIVPQLWAEEAARLLPRGRLVVIPGAAHGANFAAPAALAAAVAWFVEPDAPGSPRPLTERRFGT